MFNKLHNSCFGLGLFFLCLGLILHSEGIGIFHALGFLFLIAAGKSYLQYLNCRDK